jgi:hypothetical protein
VLLKAIHDVLSGLLEQDLHAKRVNPYAMPLWRVAQWLVGDLYDWRRPRRRPQFEPKHAIRQVDRLLSNPAINVDDILVRWVPFVIVAGDTIVVAMDWIDFDADKQATIMLALITDHGRSTPLVWLTVDKSALKDHRTLYEHRVQVRLAGIKVHRGRSRLWRSKALQDAD